MKFTATAIPEVVLIEPRVFADERGSFMETWNADKFARVGLPDNFVQDNHSGSCQGALRGLHYQLRRPQGKLTRVVVGEVFDVAVDARRGSPTFGRWVGVNLSAANRRMLWVPPGFAHGFFVLSASAEFLYKCTDFYVPEDERVIRWDDPDLAVNWPLIEGQPPLVSPKDTAGKWFKEAEVYD